MLRRILIPVLLPFVLASCSARDVSVASESQRELVGLGADDLRLCAGPPDKRDRSEGGEFWTYDRTPPGSGLSLPVPVAGGSLSLSNSSVCRATFQLVEDRVTRMSLSGSNDLGIARDAACAPVVQACLRMVREGTIRRR